MAAGWPEEMQAKFDQLKEELANVIRGELCSTERTLGEQFRRELKSAERRLSKQYQTHVDEVRKEVRFAAGAFGGTLEGIRREVHELKQSVDDTVRLHAKVLTEHSRDIRSNSRDIEQLKRRSGH